MPQWKDSHFRLFLSHISAHKEFAAILQAALVRWKIDAFVAHNDIQPTAQWVQEIEGALATMDALAAILSPGFDDSNWTDHEIGWALGRGLLVLPLRHGLDPYGLFGKYQAYTIVGKQPDGVAMDIVSLLINHPLTSSRMASTMVFVLENSGSYADAKLNMNKVEEIPHLKLSPDLLARIENAINTNGQVKDAFGVPERITSFVAQVKATCMRG